MSELDQCVHDVSNFLFQILGEQFSTFCVLLMLKWLQILIRLICINNTVSITSRVQTINQGINQALIGSHHDQFKATSIMLPITELERDAQQHIIIYSSYYTDRIGVNNLKSIDNRKIQYNNQDAMSLGYLFLWLIWYI